MLSISSGAEAGLSWSLSSSISWSMERGLKVGISLSSS